MIDPKVTSYFYGCTEDELITNAKWGAIRAKRDFLLSNSDWIMIEAQERGEAIPDAWKTYRQALRDIPEKHTEPDAVVWPVRPTTV